MAMEYQMRIMKGVFDEHRHYPSYEYYTMIKDVRELRKEYVKASTLEAR